MSDNFDLRKYLIENKITINSRMVDEAYVTPEGRLEDFKLPEIPASGNPEYDKAFNNLVNAALDNLNPDIPVEPEYKLAHALETIQELIFRIQLSSPTSSEESIADLLNPTTELGFALVATVEATGKNPQQALKLINQNVTRLLRTYDRLLGRR